MSQETAAASAGAGTPAAQKGRILLVDDDADLLQLLGMRIASAGYDVVATASAEEALSRIAVARPAVVVTDLRMGGMDGLALFDRLHQQMPSLPVIIMTAHGTIPDAVAATQRGVFGFLAKPFDSKVLLERIAAALSLYPSPELDDGNAWRSIVTRSHLMEELLQRARMVAASDASVMILGPSGSGKEVLARAIHQASARKSGPFVALNCTAIPEHLLESELFGHVRGAFSGAVRPHKGLFQAAQGGTLLLDEIGDMPLGLQVKLLRAIQERAVRPVGALEAVPVDVRLVSATHRDVEGAIRDGRFREDLYYRLNVVRLVLPSLAERREDIGLLATHYAAELAQRYRKPVPHFAPDAMELLVKCAWPGNVRQLINVVEQAVALSVSPVIPASLLQQALEKDSTPVPSLDEARRQFEYDYLVKLLKSTQGNVTHAARLADRNRTEFYKLLGRHGLDPRLFKPAGEE
ncbi:MAG: sigma 54-interacting transcriptional regulator [Burkholderiaceae bacterium]